MTRNNNQARAGDYERVAPDMACPRCGEDDIDSLVWIDDEQVRCNSYGTVYDPNQLHAKA